MTLTGVRVVSAPDEQWPVSLSEAKDHLRLVDAEDDSYVAGLIKAATGAAERHTHRAIAVQEIEATFESGGISRSTFARLPRPAHLDVTTVTDLLGDAVPDWAPVRRGEGLSVWALRDVPFLTVRFLAGYGVLRAETDTATQADYACGAPDDVKQAILITVADFYENRTSAIVGTSVSALPITAASLLTSYLVLS